MSEIESTSILLVGIRTRIDFDENTARYFTEKSRAAFMLEHAGFHHDVCCKHLVIERANIVEGRQFKADVKVMRPRDWMICGVIDHDIESRTFQKLARAAPGDGTA